MSSRPDIFEAAVRPETRSMNNLGAWRRVQGQILLDNGQDLPHLLIITEGEGEPNEEPGIDWVANCIQRDAVKALHPGEYIHYDETETKIQTTVVPLESLDLVALAKNPPPQLLELEGLVTKADGVYTAYLGKIVVDLLDPRYRKAVVEQYNYMTLGELLKRLPEIEKITPQDIARYQATKPDLIPEGQGFGHLGTKAVTDISSYPVKLESQYQTVLGIVESIFLGPQGHTSTTPFDIMAKGKLPYLTQEDGSYLNQLLLEARTEWTPPRDWDFRFKILAVTSPSEIREQLASDLLSGDEWNLTNQTIMFEAIRLAAISVLKSIQAGNSLNQIQQQLFGKVII